MFKIRAKRKKGFRRAGEFFSKESKDYPDGYFTQEQIEELRNEPGLEVVHIPNPNNKTVSE